MLFRHSRVIQAGCGHILPPCPGGARLLQQLFPEESQLSQRVQHVSVRELMCCVLPAGLEWNSDPSVRLGGAGYRDAAEDGKEEPSPP